MYLRYTDMICGNKHVCIVWFKQMTKKVGSSGNQNPEGPAGRCWAVTTLRRAEARCPERQMADGFGGGRLGSRALSAGSTTGQPSEIE